MFSNYIDFLKYFYSLQRSGIKLGLEHTIKLSEFVGNPHKKDQDDTCGGYKWKRFL